MIYLPKAPLLGKTPPAGGGGTQVPKGERLASEVRLRGLILFALGLGRKLGVVDDKALVGAAAHGAFLVV